MKNKTIDEELNGLEEVIDIVERNLELLRKMGSLEYLRLPISALRIAVEELEKLRSHDISPVVARIEKILEGEDEENK